MLDLFFNMDHILFNIGDYPVSMLELLGTLTGMACVILTAMEKVICWPVGIVNIVFFFIMFYQVHLYSDMVLQVIFLGFSIYGWWRWTHPHSPEEENKHQELKISRLSLKSLSLYLLISGALVLAWGSMMTRVHIWLPSVFPDAAAFPYGDAFTTVMSVSASILLARKKIDAWVFWVIVDIVATIIYFKKGINLVAVEYIIFGLIATSGYFNWHREMLSYGSTLEISQ